MPGPFPLATLACTVGPNGITAPPYSDIYASLQATFGGIYGTDADIDPDSQDGQMLAIFASAQNDSNQATIAAYNNYSPATAQGAGLSSVVKINGLTRDVPTNSTAVIAIGGTVGSTITNGLVGDNVNLGTQWALPAAVDIPIGGTINVTATCTEQGAVAAAPGTLTVILNPQSGWQTATNASNASVGAPVEVDAALRIRQSQSTSLAANTPNLAIYGAILDVPGVTAAKVYENDTGVTNSLGIPRNSICAVVAGGSVANITAAIASKKAPGAGTFGTTSNVIFDSQGVPSTINYDVLAISQIDVTVTLTPLVGFVSTTETVIQNAIVQYLNTLAIGANVQWGRLFVPAGLSGTAAVTSYIANNPTASALSTAAVQLLLDGLSATYDITSITLALHGGGQAAADVPIAFNAQAGGTLANIMVIT
jgi:uncharacterized phage protein gp47/JayE